MVLFNAKYPPFIKGFKHLSKRYPSLEKDFERFKKALEIDGEKLTGLVRLQLGDISGKFYKARKFRCKSLNKGSSGGIRVILSFLEKDSEIVINFIEIYFKGDKDNHDPLLIVHFLEEPSYNTESEKKAL